MKQWVWLLIGCVWAFIGGASVANDEQLLAFGAGIMAFVCLVKSSLCMIERFFEPPKE